MLLEKTFKKVTLDVYDKIFVCYVVANGILKILISLQGSPFGIPYPDQWTYISAGLFFAGYPQNALEIYYRPPLLSLIFAVIFKLGFKMNALFVTEIFFGLIACVALYILASKMFNKTVGLLSGILLSLNWHYWWSSAGILVDIPASAFAILTFLLFYLGIEKDKPKCLWLSGITAALCFLTKWTAVIILPVIAIYILLTRGPRGFCDKQLYITYLLFLGTLFPWGLLNYYSFGNPISPLIEYNKLGQNPTIIGRVDPLVRTYPTVYYLYYLPYVLSIVVCILCLASFVYILRHWRVKEHTLILLWLLIPLAAFSFYATKDNRYITLWTPSLTILAAITLHYIKKINSKLFILILILALFSTYNASILPFVSITKYQERAPSLSLGDLILAHERITNAYHPDRELIEISSYIYQHTNINDYVAYTPAIYIYPSPECYLGVLTRRYVILWDSKATDAGKVKFIVLFKVSVGGSLDEFHELNVKPLTEPYLTKITETSRYILYQKQ